MTHLPQFQHIGTDIMVCNIPDISARVVTNYRLGTIVIQQPVRFGGKIETTLDMFTEYEGNMHDFVLTLREGVQKMRELTS